MSLTRRYVTLPVIGSVVLYKRKGQKHIRISIESDSRVRISLPYWVPYQAGIAFAATKQEWIIRQLKNRPAVKDLQDGDRVGKTHTLIFEGIEEGKLRTRVMETSIRVCIPDRYNYKSEEVQKAVRLASERALLKEARALLPDKISLLARTHGYRYASLRFKKLKRRWGSCDGDGNLTFNIYLLQLPWELIDYVVLHELAHTKYMHHQSDFWDELARVLPSYKVLRKSLRSYATTL